MPLPLLNQNEFIEKVRLVLANIKDPKSGQPLINAGLIEGLSFDDMSDALNDAHRPDSNSQKILFSNEKRIFM